MNLSASIKHFVSLKNIAVIGVSSSGKGIGFSVYQHLKDNDYKVYPINKNGGTIDAETLYKSINDIKAQIDGVVTVVPPDETEKVVSEISDLGIKYIWMQQGSESKNAIEFCNKNDIQVVYGECILMFAEPVTSFHRFHRGISKLFGKYPR